MTEAQWRQHVVDVATAWVGCKESNGTHKPIIDLYNTQKPLPRGYPVKYTDAWCATYVTAVAMKAGTLKVIAPECGCGKMIEGFAKLGCWIENDAYVPKPADYIFYNWNDNGAGDCTTGASHVGIVVSCDGKTMKIVEGNMSNAVGYRNIAVNARYIRGFGVPNYASLASGATAAPATTTQAKKKYTVGKTNEETFVNFCREVLGMNLAGALGAAANVGCESAFKTGVLGDSGTSYGICQWHAGRYQNLKNWCAANGLDYTTLDGQLWFMKHELETSYSAVLSYIKSVANTADGAYNAGYRWCLKFEVPSNTEVTSQKRGALARDTYWPKYNSSTTVSAPAAKPTTTADGKPYIVVSGDTLGKIAAKFKTTVAKLADLNGIANPNLIRVGQKIYPNGTVAVNALVSMGVINSPAYWIDLITKGTVVKLEALFVQAALKSSAGKPRASTAELGMQYLRNAGVIKAADVAYWNGIRANIQNADALMKALGGAVH